MQVEVEAPSLWHMAHGTWHFKDDLLEKIRTYEIIGCINTYNSTIFSANIGASIGKSAPMRKAPLKAHFQKENTKILLKFRPWKK